jgi:hypothetical protein
VGKATRKHSSNLASFRFGSTAVFRKHVTLKQIQQALSEQVEDNVRGRPHRVLGTILREKGWITGEQEKSILKEMFEEEV